MALFSDQRDIDQPLVCVGDLAASGAASDGDRSGGTFMGARLALCRGMDFPLLIVAGADDPAAPLGPG